MSFVVTNGEFSEFYDDAVADCYKFMNKRKKAELVANRFLHHYHIEDDSAVESTHLVRAIERFIDKRPHTHSRNEQWMDSSFFELKSKGGRPKSILKDTPCKATENNIFGSIIEALEILADDNGISKYEAMKRMNSACKRKWKVELKKKIKSLI